MKKLYDKYIVLKVLISSLIFSLISSLLLYFFVVDDSWFNLFVTFFQEIRNEEMVLRFVLSIFPFVFVIVGLFRVSEEFIFSIYKNNKESEDK